MQEGECQVPMRGRMGDAATRHPPSKGHGSFSRNVDGYQGGEGEPSAMSTRQDMTRKSGGVLTDAILIYVCGEGERGEGVS
jgi:hypothetical protein